MNTSLLPGLFNTLEGLTGRPMCEDSIWSWKHPGREAALLHRAQKGSTHSPLCGVAEVTLFVMHMAANPPLSPRSQRHYNNKRLGWSVWANTSVEQMFSPALAQVILGTDSAKISGGNIIWQNLLPRGWQECLGLRAGEGAHPRRAASLRGHEGLHWAA